MHRIVTDAQPILIDWLCQRIGYVPSPHMQCIGAVGSDDLLHGVVGFDGYNGASCQMHVAGEPGWINRRILYAAFSHPFNTLGCNVVLGVVPSGNTDALRLNLHLGFRTLIEIPGAHPDGSLILMAMQRHECKWLGLPVRVHPKMH